MNRKYSGTDYKTVVGTAIIVFALTLFVCACYSAAYGTYRFSQAVTDNKASVYAIKNRKGKISDIISVEQFESDGETTVLKGVSGGHTTAGYSVMVIQKGSRIRMKYDRPFTLIPPRDTKYVTSGKLIHISSL